MFLRDRKKMAKTTRWVALAMVVVFGLGFVLLSVGSSAGGNVFLSCDEQDSVTEDSYFAQQEKFYLALLEENPADADAMIQLAVLYASPGIDRYTEGIDLLNQAIAAEPGNIQARLILAELNLNLLNDAPAALLILDEAAVIAPDDPQVFLQQGLAAKQAGENARAIAAWNRFIVLRPDDPVADTLRSEISLLATLPAVAPTDVPVEGAGEVPTE
jgi:hypothetical protein